MKKQIKFVVGYGDDVLHTCYDCSAHDVEHDCPVRYKLKSGRCFWVVADGMVFDNKYQYRCGEISNVFKAQNEIKEIAKGCKYNKSR